MRYVSVILILRWFIAILWRSSTSFLSCLFSSSNSQLGCWVLLQPNKNEAKKEEKVTAKTFLWLFVATPEISANSPLSLPVVQESTIKFCCFYNQPIRLKSSETVGGASWATEQRSNKLAQPPFIKDNLKFYKNRFGLYIFILFF